VSNIITILYAQENQTNEKPLDPYKTFTDIGIPLITLGVGAITSKYVLGSWQTRKEISDIRKNILDNYTKSFKNYVTLMDTFVAKLVMKFAKLTNENPNNKTALSEILPWGYTFNDLDYYSKKVPIDRNLRNYEGKIYTKEKIERNFKKLEYENKKCYIHFESKILNEFKDDEFKKDKDNEGFKNLFYNTREKVMEFKASLSQYYKDDPNRSLVEEFNAMWEFMMSCYILVNKIMDSKDEEEFIKLLKQYNEYVEFLYDMMLNYEQKLISKKIVIERK
jgi:hypothetical protein